MTDEFEPRARTWPHESPPARAELDAEKAQEERIRDTIRNMMNKPGEMAANYCQMQDDLAALRLENRRLRASKC